VAYVNRKEKVWLEAQDREGRRIKAHGSGLLARAMQHEIDHLNDILYIDYLDSFEDLIPVDRMEEELAEAGEELPAVG
jgi:peptide deformylase